MMSPLSELVFLRDHIGKANLCRELRGFFKAIRSKAAFLPEMELTNTFI
jgi:hypothetical protein